MRFQWHRFQAANTFGVNDVGNGRLIGPSAGGLFILNKLTMKLSNMTANVAGGSTIVLTECDNITGVFTGTDWVTYPFTFAAAQPGVDTELITDFGDEGFPMPGFHCFCVRSITMAFGFTMTYLEFTLRMDYGSKITPQFI